MTAVACGGGGGDSGVVGPKSGSTTASVTVPTQITVPPNAGALSVQVVATYDRASGAAGSLGTQPVTVSAPGSQTVPFTLDLAPCLNDAARAGGATATSCSVRVQLTLLAGGTAVDAQSVGPFTLTGGSSLTVSPGVSFVAVATIQVVPVTGAAPAAGAAARVVLGAPLALTARVLDANSNALTGRTVRWSSTTPAVATVDSLSGVVTPVAVGSTSITATVAGQTGTFPVKVVSPPNAIAVTVGAGSGSGSITSTPNGIACRVANGAASGTCTFPFASDSAVTLTATPDAGSSFSGWDGDCKAAGAASTCVVTPATALSAKVTFLSTRATTTALTLSTAGAGGGLVTSTQAGASGTISCHRIGGQTAGATCSTQYATGTQVTLTATPDVLSTFAGWSGACTSSGPTCVVTLGTTEAVPVATFAASPTANGVSVAPAGNGAGSLTITTSVTSAPCTRDQVNRPDGGTCIAPWNPTAIPPAGAIITAIPASGSQFKNWLGCPPGKDSGTTCTVSPNGVFAVAAVFEPTP